MQEIVIVLQLVRTCSCLFNVTISLFHSRCRLNILLGGMTPFYFHLVNVFLHCVVTALLMHTCEQCVFEDSNFSFLTALLFSVHPIHTEAVSLHAQHAAFILDCHLV